MLFLRYDHHLKHTDAHVRLLRDANQMIPQPVAILLAEARRREDKRTAKRVANRKSACTSRARKKALVEEMTKTNARLRRQALILALLPDLVVAINIDGTITFCSAQVERVLRHSIDDLIGANLMDILLPQSKEALRRLIAKLVAAEKVALEVVNNKEGMVTEALQMRVMATSRQYLLAPLSSLSNRSPPPLSRLRITTMQKMTTCRIPLETTMETAIRPLRPHLSQTSP